MLKFNNPSVQNFIKNWPVKLIEDKKQVNHNMLKNLKMKKKIFS